MHFRYAETASVKSLPPPHRDFQLPKPPAKSRAHLPHALARPKFRRLRSFQAAPHHRRTERIVENEERNKQELVCTAVVRPSSLVNYFLPRICRAITMR